MTTTTGNMAISPTESFIQDLKSNISYEFKTRHHTQRGLYTKAENVRDAIAILRRIQPKSHDHLLSTRSTAMSH
jgi:hypothetical protein